MTVGDSGSKSGSGWAACAAWFKSRPSYRLRLSCFPGYAAGQDSMPHCAFCRETAYSYCWPNHYLNLNQHSPIGCKLLACVTAVELARAAAGMVWRSILACDRASLLSFRIRSAIAVCSRHRRRGRADAAIGRRRIRQTRRSAPSKKLPRERRAKHGSHDRGANHVQRL